MSRLRMKPSTTMRNVGDKLLDMSKAVYRPPNAAFSANAAEQFEIELCDLFEGDLRIEGPAMHGSEPDQAPGTILRFHYDRTYEVAKGEYLNVVNVLVPDLNGKVLEGRAERVAAVGAGDPFQFDLDDFAAEALGMFTILSCGS